MAKPIAHENEWDPAARLAKQGRDVEMLKRRTSGQWHYVGDPGEPVFQNGWQNQGGTLQRLRYRWLLSGGPEIMGSITGGARGTVVFTLPLYLVSDLDGEIRLSASDDTGAFVVWRIQTDGDVIIGV